jgi:microcystin-dependent protein
MSLGKRIGIGTTQPESFLHVISDAGATIPTMIIQGEQPGLEMRLENGNVVSSLLTDENDQLVLTNTSGGVVFRTGATADPVLTLTEDGNLEITGTIFQNGQEFVGGGAGDSLPIGSFFKYPWPADPANIPAGYLKCDGSLISRTDFADLFSVIGVLYGEGDGITTFAVPTFSNHIIKFSSTAPAETIDFLPIGSTLLIPWTIDPYPKGYLKCDGREVSREVYSLLFANVGTEFGVGDGSTTFNLPILSNHGIKFQTTIKGDLDDIVPWVPSDQVGDIYYPGNVGIGVSNPVERLHVEGNILVKGNVVPAENETYDLGTSVSAFRDLYLSGDTIFLGNTKITTDPVTGSVSFLDKATNEVREIVSENTQNISANETGDTLILSGNVGIRTSNPQAPLHIIGNPSLIEPPENAAYVWTTQSSPANTEWLSVIWVFELGLFVAVSRTGTGNRVMTSPDGVNWTTRVSAADNSWRSVVWAKELGLLVAVSSSGSLIGNQVMTSPDGINWTSQSTPVPGNEWYSIAWSPELGLFAAVGRTGTGNRAMTSPDGMIWTMQTTPVDNDFRAITWASELNLFVAVSVNGSGDRVMTSSDGINWQTQSSAADNGWRSVVWAKELGLLVAVSFSGIGDRVMTSTDGINWQTQSSAADNNWLSVTWAPEPGLFIAVADLVGTGNRIMASNNGIDWNNVISPTDNDFTSVTWAPELGIFAAVSRSGTGNRVMTTLPYKQPTFSRPVWAINSLSTRSTNDNNWRSVTWAVELGLFVAVAFSGAGNRVMTSPDGIFWTPRVSAADNDWRSVTWAPELGLLVAVASSGTGNRVMTSPDGINWSTQSSAADNDWWSVTWAPELGLLVAVARTGTGNRVMTSSDGITWETQPSAADNNWNFVTWAAELGLLVAVAVSGTGNRVMTSPDGIEWTTQSSAADNNWSSVTWAKELGLLVAVSSTGTGNRVMTSPDGITWTTQSSAANNDWRSVIWAKELGLLVAVARTGAGNRVMTSPDGINWSIRSSPADNEWYSITWSKELGLLVAVAVTGSGNRVMSSVQYPDETTNKLALQIGSAPMPQPSGPAPLYSARAWVNFDGTIINGNIRTSANVSSVTRNGNGNYTINLTTAAPNADYIVNITTGHGNTPTISFQDTPDIYAMTSSSVSIQVSDATNNTAQSPLRVLATFLW